jgi:hypothetical protein
MDPAGEPIFCPIHFWQKTKVDVFALLFNIDNIPASYHLRNNLHLKDTMQEADGARIPSGRTVPGELR